MIAQVPLQPEVSGPLRVLTIDRGSTSQQKAESIDAQHEFVEKSLRQNYQGPLTLTKFGEQASGMLVDRPSVTQSQELIESGEIDLVMVEDPSRVFRNPAFQYPVRWSPCVVTLCALQRLGPARIE